MPDQMPNATASDVPTDAAAIGTGLGQRRRRAASSTAVPTIFIMSCGGGIGICGGPLDSTITIVMLVYLEAFLALKMGYAAAVSVALFAVIAAVTVINAHVLRYEIGH